MANPPPLVTIGVPVYQGEAFLADALAALCGQDHDNVEIIISDNGSTDGTQEICRRFAASDSRIRYLRSPENRGASWNYNRLFAEARGQYFKWAAHDDLHDPGFIRRCVALLQDDPGAALAFSRTRFIDGDGTEIENPWGDEIAIDDPEAGARWRRFLLNQTTQYNAIWGVIRTDILRDTGLIGHYWGSDLVLLAEIAMRGRILLIPETLFHRRLHDARSMIAQRDRRVQLAWFDPKRANRSACPLLRWYGELARAMVNGPLPLADKIQGAVLLAKLLAWTPDDRSGIRDEIIHWLRSGLKSPLLPFSRAGR
ncbi:MAG TPA: glycosyltransferase [Arenibaculum sp.]|nr:glycosyltransferase [Arenibaculum sp.]